MNRCSFPCPSALHNSCMEGTERGKEEGGKEEGGREGGGREGRREER